jgi:hypothetical protein
MGAHNHILSQNRRKLPFIAHIQHNNNLKKLCQKIKFYVHTLHAKLGFKHK